MTITALLYVSSHFAQLSTAVQILVFLPLTLATLSQRAFLLLSLLLSIHSLIHGTCILLLPGSRSLSFLQVPMHSFLLLVCFNIFSSPVNSWVLSVVDWWGWLLGFSGPLFVLLEGVSSLLVIQKASQIGKELVSRESYQLALLVATAATYVASFWWIVASYSAAASSPLASTLVGAALCAWLFLSCIGFSLRRTDVIESSGMALFVAYNLWMCGLGSDDAKTTFDAAFAYAPLLPNILPHFEALFNFIRHTLPKPVSFALVYRLAVLHLASRILPQIGADSFDDDYGVDVTWEDRPASALTSALSRLLLTYRQSIFITVYSHLLLLDASSQVWSRFFLIFLTLFLWGIEIVVTEDDGIGKRLD
ncbi:hypothetical protein MIND_00481000 [Mycena indigotica]|uniref:Uncharacterized protein n=1 Tax=Mycena indigotica TaxID=2126181 RepID=A0A8H6W8G6_9AGAR|nr:uncharacterized protein MIND_00481000 [Mycena indigotica]KAF7306886.1 hypothetical protein MIND_00481000 [Mycena indigotica]